VGVRVVGVVGCEDDGVASGGEFADVIEAGAGDGGEVVLAFEEEVAVS
jgi:hypothetical protein